MTVNPVVWIGGLIFLLVVTAFWAMYRGFFGELGSHAANRFTNRTSSRDSSMDNETASDEHSPEKLKRSKGTQEIVKLDQSVSSETINSGDSNQPKIREVKDNFGHTFTFGGDTSGHVNVDDEIVLTDDTKVQLCVTKVAKREDDELTYSYWFGNSKADHSDNTAGDDRIEDNCWTWSMQRDDYASRWSFKIWIRNQDDIYYQNNAVDSDYRVVIHYTNIVLKQ